MSQCGASLAFGVAERDVKLFPARQRGWRVQIPGWQQHGLACATRCVDDVIQALYVAFGTCLFARTQAVFEESVSERTGGTPTRTAV